MNTNHKKILFLSANPDDTDNLELIKECNRIQQKIRTTSNNENVVLMQMHEISVQNIQEEISRNNPQIVHFSGHGDVGSLAFQDIDGNVEEVKGKALGNMFRFLNSRNSINKDKKIKCVILNACYSNSIARHIIPHVDCVIGMKREVQDDTATTFAEGFYFYLCSGESVQVAFDGAKSQIGLDPGLVGENTPNLLPRDGIDPLQMFLFSNKSSNQPEAQNSHPKSPSAYTIGERKEMIELRKSILDEFSKTLPEILTKIMLFHDEFLGTIFVAASIDDDGKETETSFTISKEVITRIPELKIRYENTKQDLGKIFMNSVMFSTNLQLYYKNHIPIQKEFNESIKTARSLFGSLSACTSEKKFERFQNYSRLRMMLDREESLAKGIKNISSKLIEYEINNPKL